MAHAWNSHTPSPAPNSLDICRAFEKKKKAIVINTFQRRKAFTPMLKPSLPQGLPTVLGVTV
jgi:hypothetical protein